VTDAPDRTPPLVSVVMPTYNHAKFIARSIRSVLAQTYPQLEVIVVDNHSQDDTERIVADIAAADPRVRYFKFDNGGLVAASRNAGMDAADGKYIAFLDSDDEWLPAKLEKQVALLESRPDVFLVYSRFLVRKGAATTGIGPRVYGMVRGRAFKRLFLSDNMIGSLTVVMRNGEGADAFRFRVAPELYAIEDYDMWLRVARAKTIDYVDEPLAVYNVHDANMTASMKLYFTKNLRFMRAYRREVPQLLMLKRYVYCFAPALAALVYRKLRALAPAHHAR
jgi:glycosyltransferase involved in cell wall biosynthesis